MNASVCAAGSRPRLLTPISRLVLAALLPIAFLFGMLAPVSVKAQADVQFVGGVAYTVSGDVAVLTAAEIANYSAIGSISGTLRLELWALAAPYNGGPFNGYKLAEYTIGQLAGGLEISNVSSGDISYTPPPDGTWTFVIFVTEYTGTAVDDGYVVDSWENTSPTIVIGPAPPPGPTPPALTPQLGLWWNPNESGSGYAFDFTSTGILIVTLYSYQPDGSPQWYLSSGPLSGYTFTSTLDKYVGGQCISCAYPGRPTLIGNDGAVTIIFSSPTSATMYLPGGRVTAIQPEF
jgi:hypothetical protein